MSVPEKRPRIPARLAARIDERRVDSFEEYVRKTLARALGSYHAEPDPDSPRQMRLVSDHEVKATGVPPRNVSVLLQDISLAEAAASTLAELQENLEASGNLELAESVESAVEWINDNVMPRLLPA